MPTITLKLGEDVKTVEVPAGTLIGDAVTEADMPLEQQCAGKGTCGKCRVVAGGALAPLNEIELSKLSSEQVAAGHRLACQARVLGDVEVTLFPTVVFSNKIFRLAEREVGPDEELGLAIDLGSTTVGAFLTSLRDGVVLRGSAVLNQQTIFGADVISRLQVADEERDRLSQLAVTSICEAIRGLRMSRARQGQVKKVCIVGNTAMHHLLLRLPVSTLRVLPFQPLTTAASEDHSTLLKSCTVGEPGVFLPPLIGGFVGSDALACLLYFGFDRAESPQIAIDLGTNGEVMVTDGKKIVVTSTAAGPAFEGVNISCGTRAVEGAIVSARVHDDGGIDVETIDDRPAVGITGSGLLNLINGLRRVGVIESSGRIVEEHPTFGDRIKSDSVGKRVLVTETVYLSQHDVRQLQNAKAAIRAAVDVLLSRLSLTAGDFGRVFLTGSFGSRVDVDDVLSLGIIPPVDRSVVDPIPNGAGLGAAMFFDQDSKRRGVEMALAAEHVELNMEPDFMERFISSMAM